VYRPRYTIVAMIGAIILGLLAGFIARALMPGKQVTGILPTLLLGLAGSIVGYLIFTELLGIGDTEAFDLGGLPGAIIGALILLYLYERFIASQQAPRPATTPAPSAAEDRERRRRERAERRGRR
jgi:uncharacterized membrane protein YeaQ/YmgE (transglycosylase-associated protein family)